MQHDKVAFKLQDTFTELGIEKAALHAFRHISASELIGGGAAPSAVQRQMRHSERQSRSNAIATFIGDALRKAVNSLSERVWGVESVPTR
jgi:integrase